MGACRSFRTGVSGLVQEAWPVQLLKTVVQKVIILYQLNVELAEGLPGQWQHQLGRAHGVLLTKQKGNGKIQVGHWWLVVFKIKGRGQ